MESRADEIRDVAIEHHHLMTPEFTRRYEQMSHDRFASAFSYGREKMDRWISDRLTGWPNGEVLVDVGSGTGRYLAFAAERGFRSVGVEPAKGMREASITDYPDFNVIDGTATALPLSDGETDVVLAIEVLRYLDRADTTKFLEETFRVLRPGGMVIFSMVNTFALDGFWALYHLRRIRQKMSLRHPHCEFFTPKQVESALRCAGFVDIEVEGRMFAFLRLMYKLNPRLSRSVAKMLDRLDDRLSPMMSPFTGHLLCCARKPTNAS